jgi:NAD dependent epimerase/dehydratase family enzyme
MSEPIIKPALGEELVHAAILSSTKVMPTRLLKAGYEFSFPYLQLALRHTLGKRISEV